MKRTLCCTLQYRLGALDRVLGALTHRGYLPEQLVTRLSDGLDRMQLFLTFDCADDKAFEKLMKFMDKQIYVLSVQALVAEAPVAALAPAQLDRHPSASDRVAMTPPVAAASVASLSSVIAPVTASPERRLAHANHG
ncbi:MAG: hypothetical protein SFZ03_09540 [Candidatus Melainabacteria bacterium]|nr:hypothetical protein [Candidatus Melainabacteria bacterium]